MRLGTTPKHVFELPFPTETVSNVKITYSQNRNVLLEKYLNDCEVDGNTLSLTLSQEETFLFDSSTYVNIQVRCLTAGGDVLASNVYSIQASRCLDDEVLV